MRKELYNQKKINFLSNSRNGNLSIPLQNIAITLLFAFFLGYSAQAQSPTTNSPDPTENPADVVSIFSDSYTNVPVANFDPNWGQSGHTQVNTTFDPTGTGTNFALAYPNFNYQGTEIGSNLDLSGMDFLHIDIWVAAGTNRMVKVSPINNGTGAGEVLVEVPLTPGSWNSVALPKSAFTGMTWNSVFQLKFDGQFNADGSANTTPYDVYLDNIYFSQAAATTAPVTNAPDPTENPADVVSIFSDSYTNVPVANFDPNWGQSGHTQVNTTFDPTGTGTNFALAYPNFNYQGTEIGSNLDLSGMDFLHIDIWVAAGTNRMVKVSPINNGTGAGEVLVEVPLTPGSWNSVALPKSAFTGMTWNSVFQLKFDGQFNADGSANTTPYDVYLDNIYFSQNSGGGTEPPVPVGFVASDNIGGTPVGPGEVFLACGPNNVGGDIVYRLFFELSSAGVTDPITEANEYVFGSTGGDGGGFGPFGFVISGLDPGVEYTFWLYQYDTLLDLFSDGAAVATQVSGAGGGGGNEPLTAAPDPTEDPADVISMYSNVYTNVPVDTWLTPWSSAQLADIQIQGNDTKLYTNLDFAGIETVTSPIDASGMDFFHIDVWSPNATTFRVKLVDLGGAPTEGEIAFNIAQGEWVSLEIPLDDFANPALVTNPNNLLTVRNSIQQLIISGLPVGAVTAYLDNVYFSQAGGGNEPLTAAPDPTEDPADVISMYSNVYTNVPVDTWLTPWSSAQLADIQIQGNDTKLYTNLDFAGIETVTSPIDASGMDFFHIDVWSPNATTFRVKLVDLGGAPTEGEIAFNIAQGEWVSLEIPLDDFANPALVTNPNNLLTVRNSIQQLIISGLPVGAVTAYLDNVYFSQAGGGCTSSVFDATGLPADIDPGNTSTPDCITEPNLYTVSVSDSGIIGDGAELEDVTINITHTFSGDLEISLISPSGTELLMWDNVGGSGENFTNTQFQDGGIPSAGSTAPHTAIYVPVGGAFAATFNGEDINGEWQLKICDTAGGDTGTLDTFSITFCTETPSNNWECADATPLICGDIVAGTSTGASNSGGNASPDVFFSYTGNGDGEIVTISLCDGGTTYDSILRVFESCDDLSVGAEIAVNDDFCGLQSELTFESDGVSTYIIMVEGFGASEGEFSLAITCELLPPPPACGGVFTDTGGVDGDYSNNEDVVWTIEPDNVDDFVTVIFSEFDVESNWDALYVFDGPDTSSPLISSGNPPTNSGFPAGGWYGTNIPGPFASTHPSGALTFQFLSDGSVTRPGWVADVVCAPVPPPNDLIENAISVTDETQPYTDPEVRLQFATNELLNPDGCAIAGTPGVWYSFTAEIDGTAEASITDPSGTSFVIFYEAPSEDVGDETDLSFSPEPDNQCGPSTASNITTVAGQSYYIFVLNNGGPSDVVIDISGSLLSTIDNTIEGFTFYPNPSMDVLNLSSSTSIDSVELYNMLGQRVISLEIGATASQVDVSNLATGTYIMKVTAEGQTASYQVIKK